MTELELKKVTQACSAVPLAEGAYAETEYLVNVFLTVLDLQMHNKAVDAAIRHYHEQRRQQIKTIDDLSELLAKHPDDKEGNRQLAQYLWGNNHWTRIQWLRSLVPFLIQNDLTTHETLRAWAHRSNYRQDFKGKVKHLDIAAYKWLTMRLGVDTIKPDVHLHNFVKRVIGRDVTDDELVSGLEEVARRLQRPARVLDWSLWKYQRGAPGAI
jgi:hypothetical protein